MKSGNVLLLELWQKFQTISMMKNKKSQALRKSPLSENVVYDIYFDT